LNAGEWFRRGRLFMVSPVRGDHRRFQAEIPLIVLSKFPEPALIPVPSWSLSDCRPRSSYASLKIVSLRTRNPIRLRMMNASSPDGSQGITVGIVSRARYSGKGGWKSRSAGGVCTHGELRRLCVAADHVDLPRCASSRRGRARPAPS
jgi:hypothetical protein